MTRRLIDVAMFLLFASAVLLQWRAGSILLGSGVTGDQAKHYTSGVMAFQYLRGGTYLHGGPGADPMRFAESFEAQYPMVGIGQWPPMYYAVQAAFYLFTGPTIRSAQILSALLAAGLAAGVFFSLLRPAGPRIALAAAAVFLAQPIVQQAAWEVMSDLLTGVFVFGAIVAFAKLLDQPGNWRAAAGFVACGIGAFLSKGSAWALGPFVIVAPLLARRAGYFKGRWFWGPALAGVLIGAPFYYFTHRAGIGYHAGLGRLLSTSVGAGRRAEMLGVVLTFAPLALRALGAAVLAGAVYMRWRRNDQSPGTTLTVVAGAWVVSQAIFLFVLPLTWEPRVFLPSVAPLAVLAGQAMLWLREALSRRQPLLADAAPVLLGLLLVADAGAAQLHRLAGYQQAADALPYPPGGALILVATDKEGEGPFIAERLSRSKTHSDVILRATHVLADIDADHHETLRLSSPEAVRSYLLGLPVRFVLLSDPPFAYAYQGLAETAVANDPADFHLIAVLPVRTVPEETGGIHEIRIYENPAGREHHPQVVRTPLGSYAGGRIVKYDWR